MSNLSPDQFGGQHETLYHITDNPKFAPDPGHVPTDNTFAMQERTRPGLYVTKHPEGWVNGQGYVRPFVAEVHVPQGLAQDERWHGEKFIPAEHLDKVKVSRVMPLDAHAREEYGESGWIESHHGTRFEDDKPLPRQLGNVPPYDYSDPYKAHTDFKTLPRQRYHYDGPDAREMTPEQVSRHVSRTNEFMRARENGEV
jgi:hypothetical protein